MRFFILLISLTFSASALADTVACLSIFSTQFKPQDITTLAIKIKAKADKIYGSQEDGVGKEYAWIKALTEAGFDPAKKLKDLSKKEKDELLASLLAEVKNLPVLIAPNGKIFLLDGHHDFYVLTRVAENLSEIEIKFTVFKDFSASGMSMADFKKQAAGNGWFYGNVDKIVDSPVKITDMKNDVERSQMGLTFMLIATTFDVPIKGGISCVT